MASLLAASPAAADPTFYTPVGPVAFDESGIRGTISPVSAGQVATFNFSGAGELSGASVGDHICNDGVGFFSSCFNPMDDLFLYSIDLDSSSGPQDDFSPFLQSQTVDPRWSGYVLDDDPASREPTGELFTSNGRGVTFQNFSDPNNTAFYLQPGEATAILITAFDSGLGDAVAEGADFGVRFFPAGLPTSFEVPVAIALVPEPASLWLLGIGAICLVGWARPRR